MGKRNRNKKPKPKPKWVLWHEIHLPLNKCRSQKGRRDIVKYVLVNHKGDIVQSKPVPARTISFTQRDGERSLIIDTAFLDKIEEIQTHRYYSEWNGIMTKELLALWVYA